MSKKIQAKSSLFCPLRCIATCILFYCSPAFSYSESVMNGWERYVYYEDSFLIPSIDFLIADNPKNASEELDASIRAFNADPALACSYPARYSYLYSFGFVHDAPNFDNCIGLNEYLRKAPVDKFSYVFAAANLQSVTSMMGHGFLMIEGKDDNGEVRKHTYSYFAELTSQNPFTVAYKGIISGLDGMFALHPYDRDEERYVLTEGRTLWQYDLALTAEQQLRLRLALWELKGIKIEYLFHSFNCATLLLHALSIVEPELLKYELLFVTPLDVARAIEKEGLVNYVHVTLPASSEMEFSDSGYNNGTGKLTAEVLAESKNPTSRLQDSVLTLYLTDGGANLSLLPASHFLRTSLSDVNSSNELKIGYLDINLDRQKINELALYSFKDYNPIKRSLSSELYLGFRPDDFRNESAVANYPEVEYMLGKSFVLGRVQLVGLVGSSMGRGLSFDAKASLSWRINDRLKLNASKHFKSNSLSALNMVNKVELSYMMNSSITIFAVNENSNANPNSRLNIGVDFHF
jgi:hypothetical protein